ncbi:MAG: BatA domain-containing protein [Planctomycetota bacterium]|nr:BatA domain-containing protein [Planctomycetota bacterium]
MFEWLSGFLFNPGLAVGATAVAGPILIHIFSRRRFKRVRWAAMAFLLEAQRKNRRRVRLEQLILLLLRCLAVFLLAMMIARPFLRPSVAAALIGVGARTERIFLIDDSYSMSYRPAGGRGLAGETVFAAAIQATEQIAGWIAGETAQDSLTLLRTSDPRSPSLALSALSEDDLRLLHDHLQTMSPSDAPGRMANAIEAVSDLIRRSPTQANTTVYVVSDFQRHDWIRPAVRTEEKPRSVIAPLADAVASRDDVKLVLVDVGAEAPRNIALTDIVPLQPQCVAGVSARFEVTIANHGPDPLTDVELNVSIARSGIAMGDAADAAVAMRGLPPVLIPRLGAGQVVREPVEVTFPADGSDFLHVELAGVAAGGDRLALDNSRSIAVGAVAGIKILIVDGEPSNDRYLDEVFLLKTALRPAGRVASGNEVSVVDESELEGMELSGYHCVILANAFRPSKAARRGLETFVRDGGGLIVFAGDQIDPDVYNEELYDAGRGLLPAGLVQVVQAAASAEPVTFADWDAGRPMLRAFVDDLATVLRQVRIYGFIEIDESTLNAASPASQPAIHAETSLANRDEGETKSLGTEEGDHPRRGVATVLARFNDARRSAAIVQRSFGNGSVLFIATSADQEWNDWAGNFSYVPMMLEIVQHMARRSDTPTQVPVGEPIVCAIDTSRFQPEAVIRTPSFPIEPEIGVHADVTDVETPLISWSGTSRTGLYRIMLSTLTGEPLIRYAAVNPDASESNLSRAAQAELASHLIELDFEYVRDLSVFQEQGAGAKKELWWPLLLFAVVVLMLEQTLAWRFGTRG